MSLESGPEKASSSTVGASAGGFCQLIRLTGRGRISSSAQSGQGIDDRMLAEIVNLHIRPGNRALRILHDVIADIHAPVPENVFQTGGMLDGRVIQQQTTTARLAKGIGQFFEVQGSKTGSVGPAMMRRLQSSGTGLSPNKTSGFNCNIILCQDGGEFQIAGVAAVGWRRLAVALKKIGFKRLGIFKREQGGREHHFAQERDRLFPEFAFLFVGNLFERVFGQGVAGNDFGKRPPPQSKMMRFLSVGELSLYCALIFSASPASRT